MHFMFCLLAFSHVIIPNTKGNKNYPLKMGAHANQRSIF